VIEIFSSCFYFLFDLRNEREENEKNHFLMENGKFIEASFCILFSSGSRRLAEPDWIEDFFLFFLIKILKSHKFSFLPSFSFIIYPTQYILKNENPGETWWNVQFLLPFCIQNLNLAFVWRLKKFIMCKINCHWHWFFGENYEQEEEQGLETLLHLFRSSFSKIK
jgi:hypothetical protein